MVSLLLTAYGVRREEKRQAKMAKMMKREAAEAERRGEERRHTYLSRMAPGYRMHELALGETKQHARIRGAVATQTALQRRTADLLTRGHSLGSAQGQASMAAQGASNYLQLQQHLGQDKRAAMGAFTSYASGMAEGESAIMGQTDQNLLALAQQRIGIHSEFSDPRGEAALGYAAMIEGKALGAENVDKSGITNKGEGQPAAAPSTPATPDSGAFNQSLQQPAGPPSAGPGMGAPWSDVVDPAQIQKLMNLAGAGMFSG